MIYNIIIAASIIVITPVVIFIVGKLREKAKRVRVSEEGYETAYDILFPKRKSKKVRVAS
jgi:tetraacyldisaccharide-1-P 4'-kinase